MLCFPDHVFAVTIGHDLIVFHSGADRYLALVDAVASPAQCGVATNYQDILLDTGAARRLIEAALLFQSSEVPVTREALKPVAGAHRPELEAQLRILPGDLARLIAAMAYAEWRLYRGRSCRRFAGTRGQGSRRPGLNGALARLRETRLLMPHPRRCLPSSMIAAKFLLGLGHVTDIVFGVRSHPFAAHCWIEIDGVVLDDDVDRVRAFTPIAVGRL